MSEEMSGSWDDRHFEAAGQHLQKAAEYRQLADSIWSEPDVLQVGQKPALNEWDPGLRSTLVTADFRYIGYTALAFVHTTIARWSLLRDRFANPRSGHGN